MTPEEEAQLIAKRQWDCEHAMMATQCAHCGITKADKEQQDAIKAAYAESGQSALNWTIP